jgi:hypothetical protein
MLLVAIGWMYVVILMSVAEETAVAGIMTFVSYGVVPLAILLYLSGGRTRKRIRAEREAQRQAVLARDAASAEDDADRKPR